MALIRGDVDFMFTTLLTGMPLAKSGQIRPIAVTSVDRSPFFPELPTVAESGLQGYELVSWYGVITQAGTPKWIVEQLAKDINAMLKEPKMATQLAAEGVKVIASGPDKFTHHLTSEVKRWAGIVKQAKLQPE
jgi:tripartite-type tricarboxylate transporter receptor subunit TctC